MKKIYILLFVLGLLAGPNGYAQERQQYRFSQYFQQPHALNPSLSGIEDFWKINVGYRKQLNGLEVSPESFFMSFNGLFKKPDYRMNSVRISRPEAYEDQETDEAYSQRKRKHGFGGFLSNEEISIFRVTSGLLSYAYHIPLNRKLNLSVGVAGAVTNNGFGRNAYNVRREDDALYLAMIRGDVNATLCDVNVGTTLYGEKFYLGYTASQLVMARLTSTEELNKSISYVHHYAMIGYQMDLSHQLALQPSLLVRYDRLQDARFDANVKVRYDDLFWIGASYRNKQSLAGMFGLVLNKDVTLGYSYEVSMGKYETDYNGFHEVVLGVRLGNKYRKAPYFW